MWTALCPLVPGYLGDVGMLRGYREAKGVNSVRADRHPCRPAEEGGDLIGRAGALGQGRDSAGSCQSGAVPVSARAAISACPPSRMFSML